MFLQLHSNIDQSNVQFKQLDEPTSVLVLFCIFFFSKAHIYSTHLGLNYRSFHTVGFALNYRSFSPSFKKKEQEMVLSFHHSQCPKPPLPLMIPIITDTSTTNRPNPIIDAVWCKCPKFSLKKITKNHQNFKYSVIMPIQLLHS